MIKILLVEEIQTVLLVIRPHLKKKYKASIAWTKSYQEALQLLEKNTFDLLLCRNKIKSTDTKMESANELIKYLEKNKSNLPCIVFGPLNHQSIRYEQLLENFKLSELDSAIKKVLSLDKNKDNKLSLSHFIEIPTHYFAFPFKMKVDLYEKNAGTPVLYFKKGQMISKADFDDEIILIKKDELHFFFESLEKSLIHYLSSESIKNYLTSLQCILEIYQFDLCKSTPYLDHQKLNHALLSGLSKWGKSFKLKDVLVKNFTNLSIDIKTKKVFLMGLISYRLLAHAKKIKYHIPFLSMDNLGFATLYHDILLDHSNYHLRTSDEIQSAKILVTDKDLAMDHAIKTAVMARRLQTIPEMADIIIKEHHGVPHGDEIRNNYSSLITDASVYFIIIENFCYLATTMERPSAKSILNKMNIDFIQPRFKEAFTFFAQIISSELKRPALKTTQKKANHTS